MDHSTGLDADIHELFDRTNSVLTHMLPRCREKDFALSLIEQARRWSDAAIATRQAASKPVALEQGKGVATG